MNLIREIKILLFDTRELIFEEFRIQVENLSDLNLNKNGSGSDLIQSEP